MLITPQANNSSKHLAPPEDEVTQALRALLYKHKSLRQMTLEERANTDDTLSRAYKALTDVHRKAEKGLFFVDELTARVMPYTEMMNAVKEVLGTGFPMSSTTTDAGMVTQGPIRVHSLCPHHLLPVTMDVYVAYLPENGGTVLGLSKLARLATLLGARPVLQEQYTADVADALHYTDKDAALELPQIRSSGAAAQVVGRHSCMGCRGIRSNALTMTTALRGGFHSSGVRDEFYQAIDAIRHSLSRFQD